MFPSEMVILMAIEVSRDSGKDLLTGPSDGIREYIGYLCDSLVKRGYLKGSRSRGYRLTSEGMESLFEFLLENKTRAQDAIKTLHQLGIEASQEIDKLVEETIKVK